MHLECICEKSDRLNKNWWRSCKNTLKPWFRVLLQHWDCTQGFQEELDALVFPCSLSSLFPIESMCICINKLMRTVGKSSILMKTLMIKSDFGDTLSHWLNWDGIQAFQGIYLELVLLWRLRLHLVEALCISLAWALFNEINFTMKLWKENNLKTLRFTNNL